MSKVILITGTSSGFGKSIAEKLHSTGHIVIGTSRNADSVKSDFKTMKLDINNHEMSKNLISKIVETHGKIDILINNAGIANIGNIEACSEKDLDRLYKINIKGVYNCSKVCIPLMKNKSGGVILNMASIASTVGISDRFAYSMTKGAVLTLTYSIVKDYINDNIRCNCIFLASVHKPFVDGFINKDFPG